MVALLLTLMLAQTYPTSEAGRVSGTLRTPAGAPASGVRIAATPAGENGADLGTTLIRLAETDDEGRFVLENVPPGRYYIIAGRVDQPTLYPGTLELSKGTILSVTAGAALSGIDFVANDASLRPAVTSGRSAPNNIQITVPIVVTVEGGAALPDDAAGGPTVKLLPVAGGQSLEAPLNNKGIAIPVTSATDEYRVSIENLPVGYSVRGITFGSANLVTDTWKTSIAELSPGIAELSLGPRIVTYTGEGELQRIIDAIVQRRAGGKILSVTLQKN